MEGKTKAFKPSKKTIVISTISVICLILIMSIIGESQVKDKNTQINKEVDAELTVGFINEIVIGKDVSKIKEYLDKGCDPNYDMGNKTAFESVFIRYSNEDLNEYFISKGGDIQKFKLEDMYLTSEMLNKLKSMGAKNVTDELVKAKVEEEKQSIVENDKKNAELQAYIEEARKKELEKSKETIIPKINGFDVSNLKGVNSITGEIKNTIGYKCSSVVVYINIMDSDGNVIESTIDTMNNLEVGQTWVFDAPIINPLPNYNFKITEIKAFK